LNLEFGLSRGEFPPSRFAQDLNLNLNLKTQLTEPEKHERWQLPAQELQQHH